MPEPDRDPPPAPHTAPTAAASRLDALAAVVGCLRCPHCGSELALAGRALVCPRGHSYDVARPGHVTLLPPRAVPPRGDTAEMAAARARFLAAGHYAPLTQAIVEAVATSGAAARPGACVADLGAGTGHHLAAVLAALHGTRGIAIDASRQALRRALQRHSRMAAVVADVWGALPLGDGAADVVLNVFAPRDAREIARVLAPAGALVVVTPAPDHLRELVDAVGMLRVGDDKQDRLRAKLSPLLVPVARRPLRFGLALSHADVESLVAMTPTAHHLAAGELRRRVASLPATVDVSSAVVVETFARA